VAWVRLFVNAKTSFDQYESPMCICSADITESKLVVNLAQMYVPRRVVAQNIYAMGNGVTVLDELLQMALRGSIS
jgi:hypothetical protein